MRERFVDGSGTPFPDPPAEWVRELEEFLRIESVSGDPAHAPARRAALEWFASWASRYAGGWEICEEPGLSPWLVGRVPASSVSSRDGTPHVLLYGHADVQPPGSPDSWQSPAFEPTIRDSWLHARGVADDKGNLYALVRGALDLAAAGRLPVDVTVLVDTDEETTGEAALRHLERDPTPYVACLVYDAPTTADATPVFVVGARGLIVADLVVRTGKADVHSGLYGGAALNAAQVLVATLARLNPVPDALRKGVAPQDAGQLARWNDATDGLTELERVGVAVAPQMRDQGFYGVTFASPSLDINGIATGDAAQEAMIVPCEAVARLSMRLAPHQDPAAIGAALESLLREEQPDGVQLEVRVRPTSAAVQFAPGDPVVAAVRSAFVDVIGRAPRDLPNGATVPLVSALGARGVPTVLTGFSTPDSNFHGPDEGLPLNALTVGAAACSRALERLAAMPVTDVG
jgi:acetylornithine deacetylase/succinyl-diaminopimelate desuccinylase-like protein